MTSQKKGNHVKIALAVLLALSVIVFFKPIIVSADPSGATITFNDTGSTPTYTAGNRTDAGGTITTMNLNVTQQNDKWKAYVGNITGILTLDDANANTIFQWAMSNTDITGEVYSSRAISPTWSSINCSTVSLLETEDSTLGFSTSAIDNINKTFNETTHNSFAVAGITIQTDTCRAASTYVNDTKQDQSAAYFQEVLLGSGSDMVYASPISRDTASFHNESIVDFQMIVADDVSAASTTYYFFVEIGS